jgi:hypothetical protein
MHARPQQHVPMMHARPQQHVPMMHARPQQHVPSDERIRFMARIRSALSKALAQGQIPEMPAPGRALCPGPAGACAP